jgi:hypothetical protein
MASPPDRDPDQVTCVRCLEVGESQKLDRILWCERCRIRARARAARAGWWAGGAVAAALAAYIWFVIQPSDLIVGGWVGVTLAALYLAARLAREIFYGVDRVRNAPGVEAAQPAERAPGEDADEPPADRPKISFR